MNWFGFDFNGDGTVSFGEQMITLDMMGVFDGEKKQGASGDAFDEDFVDLDNLDLGGEREELRECLDALECGRSELEDTLLSLELHEPSAFSPAYDSWVEHCDALRDQIDRIECDIDDLEDSLLEMEDR